MCFGGCLRGGVLCGVLAGFRGVKMDRETYMKTKHTNDIIDALCSMFKTGILLVIDH